MTKSELIDAIAARGEMTKSRAEAVAHFERLPIAYFQRERTGDLFELFFRRLVAGVEIGMQPFRQATIGLANVIGRRAARHPGNQFCRARP